MNRYKEYPPGTVIKKGDLGWCADGEYRIIKEAVGNPCCFTIRRPIKAKKAKVKK